MSSENVNVGLPEVAPGEVQVGARLGMTTRSMVRRQDMDGMIDPEDSVSNIGSRASCTSVLSEAQIEIQRQIDTNRIMGDLRLAKLAREEEQAQLALARKEREAELKAEMALKEAALKAEFLKSGLDSRSRSRSGSQASSRRSLHPRLDLLFDSRSIGTGKAVGRQDTTVVPESGSSAKLLLHKATVQKHVSSPKFSPETQGVSDRSVQADVSYGAAKRSSPEFVNGVVSSNLPTYRAEASRPSGISNGFNPSGKCVSGMSPAQSSSSQQDSFFQYQNCRAFLDKASLINYNGSNMPFIFFRNRIKALIDSCPFTSSHLTLLQAACVGLAGQHISNLVADTPGLSEDRRIEMSLERLSQRFGVRGGFYAEPEVRKFRYGDKLKSDSAFALKEFKDQLSQCLLYSNAYGQPDKVEGRFVLDLAKRLPATNKEKFLEYLQSKFGHTNEPSFESLYKFVSKEEACKSSDFGISLLNDDGASVSRRCYKKDSFPVRQTLIKSPTRRPPSPKIRQRPHEEEKVAANRSTQHNLPRCFFCSSIGVEEHHFLSRCSKFLDLAPAERKEFIFKSNRCFNCLREHLLRDCVALCKCRKCGVSCSKKHHFLLHDFYAKPSRPLENGDNSGQSSVTVRKLNSRSVGATFLRVTAARIVNPATGKEKLVYMQHDPGSAVSLISSKLVQELSLTPFDDVCFEMQTMAGCKPTASNRVKFNVQSLHTGEIFCDVVSVVNEPWSDNESSLPHKQDLSAYKHFIDVNIVCLDECTSVDVLIGNDNARLMYAKQERMGKNQEDPHAFLSPLGWLACGGTTSSVEEPVKAFRYIVRNDQSLIVDLQQTIGKKDEEIAELQSIVKDLSMESVIPQWSRTDVVASEMVEPLIQVKDEHFEIPVPIIEKASLPKNYESARHRLSSVRKKALCQPDLQEFLVDSMVEMQSNNYIERAPAAECSTGQEWYLPYFVTSQVKKRIVYDGKAQFKGACVNDIILSGPDLLNPLLHVLTRFRLGKYALMSDVTKCFFQVQLPACQRDLFRLLWFENNDVEQDKMVTYRFRVHPWGIKSSPYIACLAFKKLVEENPTGASEMTLKNIQQNMYMDDLIFSADNLENAQTIAHEAVSLFKSRGFKLVKWTANKEGTSVLSSFDSELLSASIRDLDLSSEELSLPAAKTLGCVWDPDSDELRINCSLKPLEKYTRRTMLSQLGQNFDPLGFGSPFFIKARLILQQLAANKYDWDTTVPDDVVKEWDAWLHSLCLLQNFSLPRWLFINSGVPRLNDDIKFELHGFSDASNQAFSSVIYIRRLINGAPEVAFIFGKCTIVQRHQSSWPIARKELTAAVNTSKLMYQASEALKLKISKRYLWCDSQTVLSWIKNSDLRLNKFITRRIDLVLMLTNESEWRFCPTNANAADVGSRPNLILKKESRDLWLNGPTFLVASDEPEIAVSKLVPMRKINVRNDKNNDLNEIVQNKLERLIESSSSLYVLQKRVAYLLCFFDYVRSKAQKKMYVPAKLNSSYLDKALERIVIFVQQRTYGKFIECLAEQSPDNFDEIIKWIEKKKAPEANKAKELRSLKQFRPCLDDKGALRIEGRLSSSPNISYDAKHPLILPPRHVLTKLVILWYHNLNVHSGVQHTLLSTRQKFWIINGNAAVRKCLQECGVCMIKKAQPVRQLMSDLPQSRITANTKPFFYCGLDYFGPLTFVEGRSHRKAWGLLFTCMSSRAVHVELVTSLNLSEFILAFTRFSDLRGPVSTIYSDNGTTFQAAAKVLPSLLDSTELKNAFRKKSVNWEFIPPYAPAQGGAWEAMVKQVKHVISNTLEKSQRRPSFIELLTYVGSATKIVNDRPLTPLSDDPRDFTAITPASLLTPYSSPYAVVGSPQDKDNLRRDYRFNISLSDQFWKKWLEFYLPWQQGRKKWQKMAQNLKPGQLVVLSAMKDISKRGKYQLGRVHEIIPQTRNGKQIVRRVKVATTCTDDTTGEIKVVYILRDLSCIAPVGDLTSDFGLTG